MNSIRGYQAARPLLTVYKQKRGYYRSRILFDIVLLRCDPLGVEPTAVTRWLSTHPNMCPTDMYWLRIYSAIFRPHLEDKKQDAEGNRTEPRDGDTAPRSHGEPHHPQADSWIQPHKPTTQAGRADTNTCFNPRTHVGCYIIANVDSCVQHMKPKNASTDT